MNSQEIGRTRRVLCQGARHEIAGSLRKRAGSAVGCGHRRGVRARWTPNITGEVVATYDAQCTTRYCDADCGTGHCTCWSSGCNGGGICSKTACSCQYANSGADTRTGPLMDGLMDFTCSSSRMCVQGACQ
jgi:hypothetical protein